MDYKHILHSKGCAFVLYTLEWVLQNSQFTLVAGKDSAVLLVYLLACMFETGFLYTGHSGTCSVDQAVLNS